MLSKQAFQRGLMIVEELGKGLGFMFGMSEREREVEIASCNLTVSWAAFLHEWSLFSLSLSLSLSVESLWVLCFFLFLI